MTIISLRLRERKEITLLAYLQLQVDFLYRILLCTLYITRNLLFHYLF